MHKVKLPALELTIELEDHQIIIDHGMVDDMVEHTRQLLIARNLPHDDEDIKNRVGLNPYWFGPRPRTGGNYFKESFYELRIKHLRYVSLGDDSEDLFVRGHEETHILEEFYKLGVFRRAIMECFSRDLDLSRYNSETIANIGGILALKKAKKTLKEIGYTVSGLNFFDGPEDIDNAWKALDLSRNFLSQ